MQGFLMKFIRGLDNGVHYRKRNGAGLGETADIRSIYSPPAAGYASARPTVIYGLGEAFDSNLTRDDLRAMTPYNTYRIDGLPPTPIALPGRNQFLPAFILTRVIHFISLPGEMAVTIFKHTGRA